jgi:hypothetical protein
MYHGILSDHELLWKEHINNTANRTLSRNSGLCPFLGYHSNLSPVIKPYVYMICIRPIICYDSENPGLYT